MDLKSELQGQELLLQLPEHYTQPLPLQRVRLATRWTATERLNQFEDAVLELDDLQLTGHLSLHSDDAAPWVEGGLSTPELPLASIARLLPDAHRPRNLLQQAHPSSGTLHLAYSRFAGPLSHFKQQTLQQIIQEATVHLRDGQFQFSKGPLIKKVSATATWHEQSLTLSNGTALALDSPLQFSGTIKRPFHPDKEIALGAGWVLPGRNLSHLGEHAVLQAVAAEGPIPFSINLNGQGAKLQWNMQADLQACNLHYRELLTKPAGMPGGIQLQGDLSPGALHLADSTLRLGPLQLALSGNYARKGTQDFSLKVDLTETDLGQLRTLAPALEAFQLKGKLAGRYRLQGSGGHLQDGGGRLQVAGLGVHFPAVMGSDLQNLQGQMELYPDRIEWHSLSGLLGRSPIAIGGQISNWSKPRIELHITAKQLRANELIFSSPTSRLHQLDGHLVFSGNRADFNNVRVTLDGGTKVIVNGHHQGGAQPETILAATSRLADVDQVVALWLGPGKTRQTPAKHYKVVVIADVAQGTYDQLDFQQATATITATPGLVRISPVRFATGGGHCLTQIAVQQVTDQTQRLVVSGHVSGVEAATLEYGKMLDKKGLLSGITEGDFHLAGELGNEFLSTVDGGFSLALKDGVLNKFTFLAKVFSLLNVSQILTLKLPDMVEEGMPFSDLQGNFALRDGILSTEDLFITSNAMNLSLVGDVDMVKEELDLILGVKPLRTVDKLITRIPIAGWILTGEEKALITAHFEIKGSSHSPKVQAVPVTSISGKVLGIFKRVLGLPGKLITDPGEVITGQPSEPAPQGP
ncbi:MAG: AsmA-like C-terminal domain-containing protein [Syntrophotaleaceae bacterium]